MKYFSRKALLVLGIASLGLGLSLAARADGGDDSSDLAADDINAGARLELQQILRQEADRAPAVDGPAVISEPQKKETGFVYYEYSDQVQTGQPESAPNN